MNIIIDRVKSVQNFCQTYIPLTNVLKIKKEEKEEKEERIGVENKSKILFYNKDTLETASFFENPLILILADEKTPGGTYISGCQEESLFRRTVLFSHLTKDFYPILNDEILLARNVGVFTYNSESNVECTVNLNIISHSDFIVCPGLKAYDGRSRDDYNILANKIRLILDTAIEYKYKNVILGALGIGAFGCDPKEVAYCFRDVITDYAGYFDNIVFSILGSKCSLFEEIINDF